MNRPLPRVSCAVIDITEIPTVEELLGAVDMAVVFTPRERRLARAGRGVESWAGKLAAKRAVAAALDLELTTERLAEIEIVPRIDRCPTGGACDRGHPPAVVLHGESRARPTASPVVTISHVPSAAIALAAVPHITSDLVSATPGSTRWQIGVDVVELYRARRWIEFDDPGASTRLLTKGERAWSDGSGEILASCLALKESVIKVVGGRPPGTTWHDVTVSPIRSPSLVGSCFATAVAGAAGAQKVRFARLDLDGAIARERLALDGDRATASAARLAGAWCTTERHAIGLAWFGGEHRPRDDVAIARGSSWTPRKETVR